MLELSLRKKLIVFRNDLTTRLLVTYFFCKHNIFCKRNKVSEYLNLMSFQIFFFSSIVFFSFFIQNQNLFSSQSINLFMQNCSFYYYYYIISKFLISTSIQAHDCKLPSYQWNLQLYLNKNPQIKFSLLLHGITIQISISSIFLHPIYKDTLFRFPPLMELTADNPQNITSTNTACLLTLKLI